MFQNSPLWENLHYVPHYLTQPGRAVKSWQRNTMGIDLVAGITVGLIALPQAIAFALIANLPPVMGLYATVVAAIVGALWGSTVQIQTGPANAISILVLSVLISIADPGSPEYILAAGLIAVMAGGVQLVIGLARLGMLVNFVSHSVIVGFASGAAVLIGINQIRHLLGLNFTSHTLLETIQNIITHLPYLHWPTALLGLGTIAALVLLRKINRKLRGPLITLVGASLIVFLLGLNQIGVDVIGQIPAGLPPLAKLPLFDLKLITQLSSGALAIAAIGLIQTTAIARTISGQTGQRVDNNQEFVGQGMANIAMGLFSGYPGAASFSRSAVSLQAGAKTSLSSIIAGLLVLLAMFFLAPLAAYLPRAALAGVLIFIAYGLIDRSEISRIWRGTRGDTIIMLVTFFSTLFTNLVFAVLAGILFSFARYLFKASFPRVQTVLPNKTFSHFVQKPLAVSSCPQLEIVNISGDLYFGAVNQVEETLLHHLADHPELRFLLLRLQGVNNCDLSGIQMLETIHQACRKRSGGLYFAKVKESVLSVMQSTGFYDQLGPDHFQSDDESVSYLFYRMLDPAICIYECRARTFVECQNLPKHIYPQPISIQPMADPASIPEISTKNLWYRLNDGSEPPLIIDVREPREYHRGHLPTAKLSPLPQLPAKTLQLPTDRQIILVCQSGWRSRRAAQLLQNRGYKNVAIVQGGMRAWKNSRFPEQVDFPYSP